MARPLESPPTRGKRILVCQNRRALHLYRIDERLEAGLVLTGSEVKALRSGKAHLNDAYVQVLGGEAMLIGGHIAEYEKASYFTHAPTRSRKLLLHRRQIEKLHKRLSDKGMTAVALSLYFSERGHAKVEVGIGKGKQEHDKRDDIRDREASRELARVFREHNR